MTKELVVISGKGGTGKTSVAASLAVLAKRPVIADCDVDAADLHLVLSPQIQEKHEFRSGHEAIIRKIDCVRGGVCMDNCRFDAITLGTDRFGDLFYCVDSTSCEGCGVCVRLCVVDAIEFPERICGEWMVSETRCGPMVHARLGVKAQNTGKLVSIVRREARRIADEKKHPLVIVDGPPGIGCPVIASITGASFVLIVSEPTVSGEHDLKRVLDLAKHFGIASGVCVNKWDLNPQMTEQIETHAREAGARVIGRIRYDRNVSVAQVKEQTVVEIETPAASDIRQLWENLAL